MSSEEELAARLDEDEKAARAAAVCAEVKDGRWYDGEDEVNDWNGWRIATSGSPDVITHFARHDPARTLRYVEAGRAIIAESKGEGHGWAEHEPAYYAGVDFALQRLAEVYDEPVTTEG